MAVHNLEKSLEGYILALDKKVDLAMIFNRLNAAFGERFTALRDITRSSRGLMADEVHDGL